MLKVATVCSGIGSPEQALRELNVPHEIVFACEKDKYAKQTYLSNFTPEKMLEDMTKEDWSPSDLYSDIFIGGIPCQSFSLAGKRLGMNDARGTLFFNFYDYVKKQQPKAFIIENVKGLLSDQKGRTFRYWCELLGNTVNQQHGFFQHEDSLGYNLHFTVLNSKDFGVPQNRERVFLVGIRPDIANNFSFPKGEPLTIRLKDILETGVPDKYYLSEKMIAGFISHAKRQKEKGNGFKFEPIINTGDAVAKCITARVFKVGSHDNYIEEKTTDNSIAKCVTTEEGSWGYNNFIAEPVCGAIQKDNVVIEPKINVIGNLGNKKGEIGHNCLNIYDKNGIAPTVMENHGQTTKIIVDNNAPTELNQISQIGVQKKGSARVRRLTPLECFRLQGFPDSFIKPCSDSQTYKQAGNTITVNVIKAVLERLIQTIQ